MKFVKIPVHKVYTGFDDKFEFKRAEEIANAFLEEFAVEKIDRLDVVSTVYYSSARQAPEINTLLPIGVENKADGNLSGKPAKEATQAQAAAEMESGFIANTIYEPNPAAILKSLLPLVVKTMVYRSFLEAITSEQIARRVAMKNATDSAGDMMKALTRVYNRARQAAITQELSEIVAGADAI